MVKLAGYFGRKMNKRLPALLRNLLVFFLISCYTGQAKLKKDSDPTPIRASYYAPKFEGKFMANGQRYHSNVISAASLAFPLGTHIQVVNLKTGKAVQMVVTDRGPWHTRFNLDLSLAAFEALGFRPEQGWGWVTVEKD